MYNSQVLVFYSTQLPVTINGYATNWTSTSWQEVYPQEGKFSVHFWQAMSWRHQDNVKINDNNSFYTRWHKKTGTFEKPNKNWRNPRKKIIDRNWTITTCLLRDSNPYYQCLKITSCRWRPTPRMDSFTATTHFKSSRFLCHPVCVICSAECDRVAFCKTPSTGRNFQTLIICITVS